MAITESEKSTRRGQLERLALPVLFTLGLLLYLPGLGSYGPLDPTDSFFIEGARELVEKQQYLLPMFNYEDWLDKPILYFWMIVACYKVLGVSAFAGRLASALSAVLTGLVIYQGSKPTLGFIQAFVAALIFLTFPLCSVIGHESLTDMPLTLFMTAALIGFFNYLQKPRLAVIVLAYVALGLTFLCKGPVALVIVGAIVVCYLVMTIDRHGAALFPKPFWLKLLALRPGLGLLIMLVINLPWYGAATYYTKGKFLYVFFITQNFGRMVGIVNHIEPFWYYIPVVLGGLFPLSLVLFSSPMGILRKAIRKRTRIGTPEGLAFFSLVWAGLVLLLFCSLRTKLATYILPAMPPMAILATLVMDYWVGKGRVKALWPTAAIFILAGLGGMICSFVLKPSWVKIFLVEQQPLLILTVIVGFVYLFLLLKNKAQPAFALILASAVIGVGVCVPLGHKVFYREVHKPFEAMIMQAIADHAQLATVVTEEPSISYFLHRHVDVIKTPVEAQQYLMEKGDQGESSHHYLIVPEKCLKDMEWFPPNPKELAKIHRWTLFSLD
jgi:4-amino-4-deoxy-L-arabinose transferase-like glycosyltransferase